MVGRTLRLAFRHPDAPTVDATGEPEGPGATAPELEFSAYTEDCRLFGRLRFDGDRLTDMLNALDELVLVDVMVESLAGDRTFEASELAVGRDELIAVEASGPRGNPDRRVRVRPFPIGARLGPYQVRGYAHVTPGADPIVAIRRRRPIVPITEATIEYSLAGTLVRRRTSTLLFNRLLADWIVPSVDEAIEYPELPISADKGPLTKDFTGQIHVDPWVDEAAS